MQLDDFYKGHNFYNAESLDLPENYYVLKENDEIIAGIHAQKTTWKIKEIPNRMGLLMLRLLSVIPGLKKSFNPGQLSFLSLYGLYCKKDYEHKIPVLFESICHLLEVKIAFYWDDEKSPVLGKLYQSKKMGWFKGVFKDVRGFLFVKLFNTDPSVTGTLSQKPFYIHPGDLS